MKFMIVHRDMSFIIHYAQQEFEINRIKFVLLILLLDFAHSQLRVDLTCSRTLATEALHTSRYERINCDLLTLTYGLAKYHSAATVEIFVLCFITISVVALAVMCRCREAIYSYRSTCNMYTYWSYVVLKHRNTECVSHLIGISAKNLIAVMFVYVRKRAIIYIVRYSVAVILSLK